uniref:CHK kinase-like domain-containing protein n=1 Tax=Dendroctonus ponderosae TaxID=77166 RepID=J3JW66_DENPD|nr:unknown [Dendroctonus ponderosae]
MSSLEDTRNHIEEILQQVAASKKIIDYEMNLNMNVEVGDGFVSQFYKAQIVDKTGGAVLDVAIKKAPLWAFDFSSIFLNEINFYTQLLPALNQLNTGFDNTPQCLLAEYNGEKTFIAMEDLKPQGYQLYDKKKYFDAEHFELIFRTYGKFHASSFALRKRQFEDYQKIQAKFKDVFGIFMEVEYSVQMFKSALSAAVDGLDPESPTYTLVKDIPENCKQIVLKSFEYSGKHRCSTHGDCWSNNMLFKYSPSDQLQDVKLIDFQLSRDGTPVHDLSYFFYSSASRADLARLEDYLKIYHQSLAETLEGLDEKVEDFLSWDELLQEWKEHAAMGIFLGIYLWQIKLLDKGEYVDQLKSLNNEESKEDKIGMNDATKMFITLLSQTISSDAYKERSRNLLEHAQQYGVLTKEKIEQLLSSE